MTAETLLAELTRRGVKALALGETLRLVPRAALDDNLIAEARRLKPEILRLLAGRPEVSSPTECGWCGGVLAPYLLDLAGRAALLCLECRRWTLAGGAS